jgi:glyoxylase-like metal-dependent hydrolase (beta-lactamase superfamily II)
MKTALFAGVAVLVATPIFAASNLTTQVYTSSAEGGWVTSTLIAGDRDAILVDAQKFLSEAHRVAAMVLESKKNLTIVYITHSHPDHYFGLTVIKQAFPNAKIVALPATVAGMQRDWRRQYNKGKPIYGDNYPANGPVLPEVLSGNTLTLEGQTLKVMGGLEGDSPDNSYVWIPSIKTVVTGDTVYNGIYFVPPKVYTGWTKSLDQIAALKPTVVIPGHRITGAKNDVSAIEFMRVYMHNYNEDVASSKSAAELVSKTKKRYPGLGLEEDLIEGADEAFPAKKAASK